MEPPEEVDGVEEEGEGDPHGAGQVWAGRGSAVEEAADLQSHSAGRVDGAERRLRRPELAVVGVVVAAAAAAAVVVAAVAVAAVSGVAVAAAVAACCVFWVPLRGSWWFCFLCCHCEAVVTLVAVVLQRCR